MDSFPGSRDGSGQPLVVHMPDSLSIVLGGAEELGMVYINILRGAKEPRNLQNHRGVALLFLTVPPTYSPLK